MRGGKRGTVLRRSGGSLTPAAPGGRPSTPKPRANARGRWCSERAGRGPLAVRTRGLRGSSCIPAFHVAVATAPPAPADLLGWGCNGSRPAEASALLRAGAGPTPAGPADSDSSEGGARRGRCARARPRPGRHIGSGRGGALRAGARAAGAGGASRSPGRERARPGRRGRGGTERKGVAASPAAAASARLSGGTHPSSCASSGKDALSPGA